MRKKSSLRKLISGIDAFHSHVERFERACDTRQQEAIERAIQEYRDYVGSLKDAYEFVR